MDSYNHQRQLKKKSTPSNFVDKSLLQHKIQNTLLHSYRQPLPNSNCFSSTQHYRCGSVYHKNTFDKRQNSKNVFICKVHSESQTGLYQVKINNDVPYSMVHKPRAPHMFNERGQKIDHI